MASMSTMKQWMLAASPAQQNQLAEAADTSRQYLYHLSGGFRDASPELAKRIERATERMAKEHTGQLPRVYRTDLNSACRNCEFAQKCLGAVAVASQFAFLPADDTEGGTV